MLFHIADLEPDDMHTYFRHTIVRVCRDHRSPVWAQYLGWSGKGHHFCRGKKAKHTRACCFFVPKKSTAYLDVRYPAGYYNTPQSVLYCERYGTRQNLKGLSRNNMHMIAVEGFLIQQGLVKGPSDFVDQLGTLANMHATLTPQLAAAAFETPWYPPIKSAIVELRKRKVLGRALSPDFLLVPHHNTKEDFLLFFHDLLVAELVDKDKIRVLVPAMKQEILDLLSSQNVNFVRGKE